jgi:histidine triad (HIT) family protein
MHNHAPPGYVCPLCLIAKGLPTNRGDQEGDVVWRSNRTTALIAGKWWRANPGHVIIMPNEHIENLYDMPARIGHAMFDLMQLIAVALKETYRCDGTSIRQHNEPAGNQDVWHFHLHVFPRYTGDNLYLHHADTFWPSAEQKRPYAETLRQYFADRARTPDDCGDFEDDDDGFRLGCRPLRII